MIIQYKILIVLGIIVVIGLSYLGETWLLNQAQEQHSFYLKQCEKYMPKNSSEETDCNYYDCLSGLPIYNSNQQRNILLMEQNCLLKKQLEVKSK